MEIERGTNPLDGLLCVATPKSCKPLLEDRIPHCISLNISAFLYISLFFYPFLYISLNFSVFLYISLNFSTFFLNFSAFLVSGLKDPNVLYYRKAWDSRIQGDHDQLYLMIRYLSVSHPVLNMTFTCHMACPPIQLVPPFNWSSHWTWARWI